MRCPVASALPVRAPALAALIGAAMCFLLPVQSAQAQAPAPAQPPASAAALPGRVPAAKAPPRGNGKQATTPLWRELTPAQQQALAPLSGTWDTTISAAQKRKWLALAPNFPKLSPDEQAKLHSRMSEWAAMSPQQRTQARLNFGVTKQVPAEEKKAQWEAYQALSPEEKRKFAASAPKPPAAAAAVKPVPPDKLATVRQARPAASAPRALVPSGRVDSNTLLPRQPAPAAPAAAPPPAVVPAPPPTAVPAAPPAVPPAPAAAPGTSG